MAKIFKPGNNIIYAIVGEDTKKKLEVITKKSNKSSVKDMLVFLIDEKFQKLTA